jgi:FtsP/CotA-like multicopper oxidase with cupredoxin domain
MRRAVAAIAVCSLGGLVAPLASPPPAALAVHDAGDNRSDLAASECPSGGIPICSAKICRTKTGEHVACSSQCESDRAGATRINLGARNVTQPAATWVVAQASTAVGPGPTPAPGVAGEPLRKPPVCSTINAGSSELQSQFCRVAPLAGYPGQHELTLSLTATTSPVHIGGYRFETDNYDGTYLPPVVELNPGDSLSVRLLNALASDDGTGAGHGAAAPGHDEGSTNLHTHGLIVSPKNARDDPRQNGDNIFVSLGRGQSLDYSIQIPTRLPASILDVKGAYFIPHPTGLYWYHSHEHGISDKQVGGGMAGVLSIGPPDANLVSTKETTTAALRASTNIDYVMLRDIQITSTIDPTAADGHSPAVWQKVPNTKLCGPPDGAVSPPLAQRNGYCQSPNDKSQIWLFTVNGQRYPTIRIPNGRNELLRVANLSPSATYVISLHDPSGKAVSFDLISVDGAVPGVPKVGPTQPVDHPAASKIPKLLLMPASRAEIFIGNDQGETSERHWVLQTDGIDTAPGQSTVGDSWPQVNLAEVILEGAPTAIASAAPIGLNEYVAEAKPPALQADFREAVAPDLPAGCVRDIDRSKFEHRRISFQGAGTRYTITTDIVYPKDPTKLQSSYKDFQPDTTAQLKFVYFDQYLTKPDGTVDWDTAYGAPKHTCVRLANGHGQLWELENGSGELHNFHIHQTKFRVATDQELASYGIDPKSVPSQSGYEIKAGVASPGADRDLWNDTIPMYPKQQQKPVFIIINFDADEQLGRYVYHCHILEHEDNGLMAPMEVVR